MGLLCCNALDEAYHAPDCFLREHPYVDVGNEHGPVVRGTKVPVRRLWQWHQRGVSVEVLIKRYPQLRPAKVLGALAFAYDNERLIQADIAREKAVMAPWWGPPEEK